MLQPENINPCPNGTLCSSGTPIEDRPVNLKIVPKFYAPKYNLGAGTAGLENSHMVMFDKCNFRCVFCDNWENPDIDFKKVSIKQFKLVVKLLMQKGKNFKFTGGEPTLSRSLEKMLGIVKSMGGNTYLDSNGSNPAIIERLAQKDLIDVLGISLKGLNEKAALSTAGIVSGRLAWENPLATIKKAARSANKMKVLVTAVFFNKFEFSRLLEFSDILDNFGPGVYLKINNLLPNSRNSAMNPLAKETLPAAARELIKIKPYWKGRVIVINDRKAIGSFSDILFF